MMYPPYGITPQPTYPGQPPVGYIYQPVYMPPRPSTGTTRDGIRIMIYFMVLQIITVMISSIVILPMLISFMANPLANIFNLIGILLGLLGVALLTLALQILALIKLWEGNKEFGPEHERNVRNAIIMVIAQFVVGNSLGLFIQLTMNFTGSLTQMLLDFMGVELTIGIISAVLGGLFLYFIVKRFMLPGEAARAYLAIGMFVTAPVVNMSVLFYLIITSSLTGVINNIYMTSVGALFSITGNLLFLQIYWAVLNRIITGQIKPLGPPMNGPGPAPLDQYGRPIVLPRPKAPQHPQ